MSRDILCFELTCSFTCELFHVETNSKILKDNHLVKADKEAQTLGTGEAAISGNIKNNMLVFLSEKGNVLTCVECGHAPSLFEEHNQALGRAGR